MFGLRSLVVVASAGLSLAGCTDGYGYSGVSVGYGNYYDSGYYGGGYYGGGYAPSYYGWYGDYYYPGTGYYVYDRYRRPYRWNDSQRSYWESRRQYWRGDPRDMRDNWQGYDRNRGNGDRNYRDYRNGRDYDSRSYRPGAQTYDGNRSDRRDDGRGYGGSDRSSRSSSSRPR